MMQGITQKGRVVFFLDPNPDRMEGGDEEKFLYNDK